MTQKNLVIVLLVTLLATALFAVGMVFLLRTVLGDLTPNWVGLLLFASVIAFAVFVLNTLSKHFLYPEEMANITLIGGIRYGTQVGAVFSGKCASWPFAKLLIDDDKLWIHNPWETVTHYRLQSARLEINKSLLFPSLTIYLDNSSILMTFTLLPWHHRRFTYTLKTIGYGFTEE